MKISIFNFYSFCLICAAFGTLGDAWAVPVATGRSDAANVVSLSRGATTESKRSGNNGDVSRSAVRRGTVKRSSNDNVTNKNARSAASVVRGRTATSAVAARSGTVAHTASARSAINSPAAARSAVRSGAGVARSGVVNAASRGMHARATAIYDDVSKIGGGYAACRDAYTTCMDQLCGKANEKYRRCYCSSKFTDFNKQENGLDQAKMLLAQFEDNNLNAVDKTAEEVNAMYTATIGEQAIKKDASAAQKTLSQISDLLAGKSVNTNTTKSSTGMSVNFSGDISDIWGDSGADSIFGFGNSNNSDMSELSGVALYNQANSSCLSIVADSCPNDAMLNMARSSYNILIGQDCNAYEKSINTQRESLAQAVRTAEKYLRDARLEEYRAHNSADVNECVAKVKTAMMTDAACGENYARCLDYSGAMVSQTGEAIYSPMLFKLSDQIILDGSMDVLSANSEFDKFLESKRMYANTALDTCRSLADTVWTEFKRSALIEIAQAQDVLIEEVKSSCVSTVKQCYDTQSGALKSFDTSTAQVTGALSEYAAQAMCREKLITCAALYGDTDACTFQNGRLVEKNGGKCGMSTLLAFAETVGEVRVAEGCATAIDNYVKDLCTPPSSSGKEYPWGCRLKNKSDVEGNLQRFAVQNCSNPDISSPSYDNLELRVQQQVESRLEDVYDEISGQLAVECAELDGRWVPENNNNGNLLAAFYSNVYGGQTNVTSWGRCIENSEMMQCLSYNDMYGEGTTTFDQRTGTCNVTDQYYENVCASNGGVYDGNTCYIDNSGNSGGGGG